MHYNYLMMFTPHGKINIYFTMLDNVFFRTRVKGNLNQNYTDYVYCYNSL